MFIEALFEGMAWWEWVYMIGFGLWFLGGLVSALNAGDVIGMVFKFIINTIIAIFWPISMIALFFGMFTDTDYSGRL